MDINIAESFNESVDIVFRALPIILGALLILLIGHWIAKGLSKAFHLLLNKAQLNETVAKSPAGNLIFKVVDSPTRFLGRVTYWILMLGVISLAISLLGIPALTDFVKAIYGYLPDVLAAILIFLVASAVSAAAGTFVSRVMGDTPTGKVVGTGIPVVVMSIAGFMILNQLGIAPTIVTITYATIMGSVGLGLALAFGLGGRGVAEQILTNAYTAGQRRLPQVKKDFEQGKKNAHKEAKKAKQKITKA